MFILIKKATVITLLSIIAISCGNRQDVPPEIQLTGERILIAAEEYSGENPLILYGDTLVAATQWPDHNFSRYIFDGDSLKPLGYMSKKGEGPGESLHSLISHDKNGQLYVMNTIGLNPSSLDAVTGDGSVLSHTQLDTPLGMSYSHKGFLMTDSLTVLLAGFPNDTPGHILTELNFNSQEITPLKFMPDDNFNIAPFVKSSFYTSNSQLCDNGEGKYVYGSGNRRLAFIFTIAGDSVKVLKNLYDEPQEYGACSDGLNYKKTSPILGPVITADMNRIYSLVVDRHVDGTTDYPVFCYGNLVEEFDWNGNRLNTYRLDHLGYLIMTDTERNLHYLFSINPETGEDMIWRYNLK